MDKSWRTPSGSLSIRPSFSSLPFSLPSFPFSQKKRLILRLAVGGIDFRRNALQFHSSQVYRCSYVLSHRTRETSQRRVSKSANSWKYRVCSQFFYLLSVLKRANKNTDHGGFLALRARSPTVTSLAPPSNSYAPLGTDRLKNSPLDAPVPVTYTGSAGNISNQMKPFNFFSRQNYYFPGVCFVVVF